MERKKKFLQKQIHGFVAWTAEESREEFKSILKSKFGDICIDCSVVCEVEDVMELGKNFRLI